MALVHEPWHELPDSSSSRSPSVPGSFVPTVRCKSRYCCSMPHDVRLPSYALHVSVRCITSRALVVHRACFCWALGPSIIARGRSTEGGRGTTHTELARPPRGTFTLEKPENFALDGTTKATKGKAQWRMDREVRHALDTFNHLGLQLDQTTAAGSAPTMHGPAAGEWMSQ